MFVFGNKRLLNFGFLFNFFSSFGQTFFISLFVPYWVDSMQINNTLFGIIYASVTMVSALLLWFLGRFIDRTSLPRFSLLVLLPLIFSVFFLSRAENIVLLIAGLLLVRFFGQGLMSHTSATGIAKYYEADRGKALGITSLGHPAGQLLLPVLAVALIKHSGWQDTMFYMGIVSLPVLLISVWAIKPVTQDNAALSNGKIRKHGNKEGQSRIITDWKFWVIALNIFIVPFLYTSIFLYQYTIGETKGYDASWVAFSFTFFAVFNAIAMIVSGELIDRFSGVFLFPLYLVPAIAATGVIALVSEKWAMPGFYSLLGISSGLGTTVKTAIQAEIYGTGNLGKIRSYFTTILVISTAAGLPLFGYLLDRDVSVNIILGGAGLVVFIIMVISFRLWKGKNF